MVRPPHRSCHTTFGTRAAATTTTPWGGVQNTILGLLQILAHCFLSTLPHRNLFSPVFIRPSLFRLSAVEHGRTD